MTGFFTQIEDTEDVRQGDIIRKFNSKTGEVEKLGIVITADGLQGGADPRREGKVMGE